jgi:4-aminobutyrate aminotransferase
MSVCLQGLLDLTGKYPIIDIRGRGLMCAAEFGGKDGMSAEPGVAAAVTKAAGKRNMLLLTAGAGAHACSTFLLWLL